jgi:hypothetical protein
VNHRAHVCPERKDSGPHVFTGRIGNLVTCAECGTELPDQGPDRVRLLLAGAIDPYDAEDRAVVEATAMLAAGHGVRFVFTVRDGLHVDVRAERLDYDHVGRVKR